VKRADKLCGATSSAAMDVRDDSKSEFATVPALIVQQVHRTRAWLQEQRALEQPGAPGCHISFELLRQAIARQPDLMRERFRLFNLHLTHHSDGEYYLTNANTETRDVRDSRDSQDSQDACRDMFKPD
jgi:hypothetical protein